MEPPAPRAFISYARADGRALADDLRTRLEAAGLPVWRDLEAMRGGRDWWAQIEEAIRAPSVEHLVLVLTEAASRSDIVLKEVKLARREGVEVWPVCDPARKPDFRALPAAINSLHVVDIGNPDQVRRMIRGIEGPSTVDRAPFMAPDPPQGFVPRPAVFAPLKAKLLCETGDAVAITAALKGAGGFGKTSLATMLAHDEDIFTAFDHGVLWTTLGETPGDVLPRMNELIAQLRPDAPRPADRDAVLALWRETLAEKRCLIVIDDVWAARDAAPFFEGGPACARLLTTRDARALPPDRDIVSVEVDQLSPEEARTLLTAPDASDSAETAAADVLAGALGNWALMLTMARAMIRRDRGKGFSLIDALAKAEARFRRKGLAAFRLDVEAERNRTAASCIDASIDALEEDEPGAAARFEMLGALAEDADAPAGLAARLWREDGFDDQDALDLLERLDELSLITEHEPALARADPEAASFRLHDHMRMRLWDAATGAEITPFVGHESDVTSVALSDDGARVLTGSDDRTARLWDAATGAEITRFEGHEHWVTSVALSADGARLLTGAWDRTARLWDAATGAEITRFEGHENTVSSVALSADGARVLTGPDDRTARLWDAATGAEITRFEGHQSYVTSVALSDDGARVLTGSYDDTARLWDAATGAEITRFVGHERGVTSVALSDDGARVLTGSSDRTARLWDAATGAEITPFVGHERQVTSVALSDDGARVLTGSSDRTARLWDAATGAEIARMRFDGWVTSVTFDRTEPRVAVAEGRRWTVLDIRVAG